MGPSLSLTVHGHSERPRVTFGLRTATNLRSLVIEDNKLERSESGVTSMFLRKEDMKGHLVVLI